MRGFRNVTICLSGLAATAFVAYAGIVNDTDPVGLSMNVGAIWGGLVGAIYGRGYNKGKEALNGGVQ